MLILTITPKRTRKGLTPFSAAVNSPEVHDDRTVTFRVNAPDAQNVALNPGAINTALGKGREAIPFTKGDDRGMVFDHWPTSGDMYSYHFRIDGAQIADPNNTQAAFTAMPPYSQVDGTW